MTIERANGEILLKVSDNVDVMSLQKVVNFLKYRETLKKSKASETEVNELADELKRHWWQENRERFLQ
ncbi:hypothetical protein SAMN05443429_106117 [Cruoricaptor ignavus]|uniref:Uncharacterized protein n=1 Tax=Cruoricaptor ignavus TaxID=1118202 RepID=A0A1M6F663_9FLAO|nr:hypothetical protein [Cruoricaptor ignavus]QOR73640.1 hypothetical protein IMZ16_09010 [Cruoricaptor ignavus]SHI93170.1 hypothetical protein SAMN05443429_106117 [Cruoricaptor ignavus]